jgi:hypothetical protein
MYVISDGASTTLLSATLLSATLLSATLLSTTLLSTTLLPTREKYHSPPCCAFPYTEIPRGHGLHLRNYCALTDDGQAACPGPPSFETALFTTIVGSCCFSFAGSIVAGCFILRAVSCSSINLTRLSTAFRVIMTFSTCARIMES